MRNDALDELDSVPSLTTDGRDRRTYDQAVDELPERGNATGRGAQTVQVKGASTGPLWALVGAMLIALAGLGWWSYQQITLLELQLVATQESFARISEDAAGRIRDISGKVVATESTVTSGSEALKIAVRQLETKVVELSQAQKSTTDQLPVRDQKIEQMAATLKTQQETQQAAAQGALSAVSGFDAQLKALASEQAALKSSIAELDKAQAGLKGLGSDIEALKKQGNPTAAIARLEQDLLVLRSELDNRPAPTPSVNAASTAEFDAFRAQMTRNISTLQTQVQNLQQQLNAR